MMFERRGTRCLWLLIWPEEGGSCTLTPLLTATGTTPCKWQQHLVNIDHWPTLIPNIPLSKHETTIHTKFHDHRWKHEIEEYNSRYAIKNNYIYFFALRSQYRSQWPNFIRWQSTTPSCNHTNVCCVPNEWQTDGQTDWWLTDRHWRTDHNSVSQMMESGKYQRSGKLTSQYISPTAGSCEVP